METSAIIATISAVIKAAVDLTPLIISTVEDAKPFAEEIVKLLSGGSTKITQADLDALEARVDALSAQLQVPLPDEPSEPA